MPARRRGTSFRPLAKALESRDAPAWLVVEDRIAYLNAALASWLDVDPEDLLDQSTRADRSPASTDQLTRLERLALQLAPPPLMHERRMAFEQVPLGDPQPQPVAYLALDAAGKQVVALGGFQRPAFATAEQTLAIDLHRELERLRPKLRTLESLPLVLGSSGHARQLRRRLELAATVTCDLFFVGPKGSGAEQAARTIDALRRQRANSTDAAGPPAKVPLGSEPLVVIDGALMDPELIEATVAPVTHWLTESTAGWATVILRDLEHMPLDAQQRLDQIAEVFPDRVILVGISRRPLADLVAEERLLGRWSERFGLMPIEIVPLAERSEDLLLMATELLRKRTRSLMVQAERFNQAAGDRLRIYPWPGNYTELEATVRQAARSAIGPAVMAEQLPLAIRSFSPTGGEPAPPREVDFDQAVREFEAQLIAETLDQAGGNRAAAARRLKISRARLLRKLEDLGIDDQESGK